MTDFVKDFLTEYIDEIDASDWTEVIVGWQSKVFADAFYDDKLFAELCNVFKKAGIDFLSASLSARQEYMRGYLEAELSEALDEMRRDGDSRVGKAYVLNGLECFYGFKKSEIIAMLDDIAETDHYLHVGKTAYSIE